MSELITDAQIADGMNAAYVMAGHNAYFGNGFRAGVEFALKQSNAPQMLEMLKSLVRLCDSVELRGQTVDRAKQLIQQATTI